MGVPWWCPGGSPKARSAELVAAPARLLLSSSKDERGGLECAEPRSRFATRRRMLDFSTGSGPGWAESRISVVEVVVSADGTPQVGAIAPDFRLPSTSDGELALSSLRGRKVVILFYVLAFTGG